MKEKEHILKDASVSYGSTVRVGDIAPKPLENLEEVLRSRGYISHDELVQRLSKYL